MQLCKLYKDIEKDAYNVLTIQLIYKRNTSFRVQIGTCEGNTPVRSKPPLMSTRNSHTTVRAQIWRQVQPKGGTRRLLFALLGRICIVKFAL